MMKKKGREADRKIREHADKVMGKERQPVWLEIPGPHKMEKNTAPTDAMMLTEMFLKYVKDVK